MLAWHLLSKDEDYRYGAPTITQRKLRNLQRKADDTGPKISLAGEAKRKVLERRFLEEAERNYRNYVSSKASRGAGAANGDTTLNGPLGADDARQALQSPDACSSRSGSPRRKNYRTQPLTFSSVFADPVGRGTGFRRESPLSRDRAWPALGRVLIAIAGASRGGRIVPAASSIDVVTGRGQSARAIAQQKPVSSRATATATSVRRLPRWCSRRRQVWCRRCWAFHEIAKTMFGLAVLASGECLAAPGRAAIMPGGLDEQSPRSGGLGVGWGGGGSGGCATRGQADIGYEGGVVVLGREVGATGTGAAGNSG